MRKRKTGKANERLLLSYVAKDDAKALKQLIESKLKSIELGPYLIFAACEGKVHCLSMMIELGAEVNYQNESNETPFSFACADNQLESAKILYKYGANINTVLPGNATPLDVAVCWTPPEFRNWLRSVGGIRGKDFAEWPWPPPNSTPHIP